MTDEVSGKQNQWTLTRIVNPDIEPVTVTEAKSNSRVDSSADDTLIQSLITAAREWVEDYTGRALIDQTFELTFQGYSCEDFRLHRSPVIAINSFVYDDSGTATTLAADQYSLVDEKSKWPRVMASFSGAFPTTNYTRPLTIQFRAGYANRSASPTEGAEKVPEVFKQAIKLLVGHFYENREAIGDHENVPNAVKWLLSGQRCETGIA